MMHLPRRNTSGSILAVCLAMITMLAGPASRSLAAQVVCTGQLGCAPYGDAFTPSFQNGVLRESAEQAARAAMLNAIFGMPLAIEAPENFGAGLQFSAARGSINRTYGSDLISEDANTIVSGWPVAVPAYGGALGSSLYLNLPGSALGLRRDYVLGVHGGFHSLSYQGENGAEKGSLNLTAPADSYAVRTRNLGVRLGVPLVAPAGWAYLRWNGVQGSLGLSYSHNRTNFEGAFEVQPFLQGNALDTALASGDAPQLLRLQQGLEYRVVQTTDSTSLVVPLEFRTGVRIGFLSLGVGLGGSLNHGRSTVETTYGGEVCGGGSSCAENRITRDLSGGLVDADGAAQLSTAFDTFFGGSRPEFIAYDRRRINSRAFVPFASARVSLHFFLFDVVISGVQSRDTAAASVALETVW